MSAKETRAGVLEDPRLDEGRREVVDEGEQPENVDPPKLSSLADSPASTRTDVIRRRDSLYRRLLALADMLAIAFALTFSAIVLGDDKLALASLAVPILFVPVVKAMGLYDRDQHLLHKTTLDEVPALFGIATLAALLLVLANGLVIDGELGRRQVLGTWW